MIGKRWIAGIACAVPIGIAVLMVVMGRPRTSGGVAIDEWIRMLCRGGDYGAEANAHHHLLSAGERSVPRLISALDDRPSKLDPHYRRFWMSLPDSLKSWLPNPLLRDLHDRRPIFRVLTSIGAPLEDVVSAVARGATHQDSEMRFFAVHSLRELATTNTALLLPIITNALRDGAFNVRGAGLGVLGTWGDRARPQLPEILAMLNDPSESCRQMAASTLEQVGAATPEVVAALTHSLGDADQIARLHAARALFRLTGQVEPSLSVVAGVLNRGDFEVRAAALNVASAFGTNAAPLLPLPAHVTLGQDFPIRLAAERLKWSVTGNAGSILPMLSQAMLSGDRPQQLQAVRLIESMGITASPTVPALIEVLSTPQDWLVQQLTIEALKALDTNAVPALPALTNQLAHRVMQVREAAANAIDAITAAKGAAQGP